jgi:hypothetical protein
MNPMTFPNQNGLRLKGYHLLPLGGDGRGVFHYNPRMPKDITVAGGARAIQQSLKAGLPDEIHPALVHGPPGEGSRSFEKIGAEQIELKNQLDRGSRRPSLQVHHRKAGQPKQDPYQ